MTPNIDFDHEINRRGTDATKFAELTEKYGRDDLLPLWIADMDFATPEPIRAALHKYIDRPVLGYTTAPDSFWDSIVSWLKDRHGWQIDRTCIDFVPGLKKGLGLCFNYFTRPGDGIVIQPPVYHSFRSVIEGNGRRVITNPLILDGDTYRMNLDGLEKSIAREHPVMMVICNPHNPLGIQWDKDTLKAVASICHRNNIILLSDEIYGDMIFGNKPHIPTASVSEKAAEITVTLGAPTKTFNMPGIASAWAAITSPELRDGFFAWLKASEFDTPGIGAIYATEAAYTSCREWLDKVLVYLNDNAVYAIDYINRNMPQVSAVRPNTGFGLWINFRETGLSHDQQTDMLVNHAKVAISDGTTFGEEGTGFIRLNIGVPRTVLTRGLDRIAKALKEY